MITEATITTLAVGSGMIAAVGIYGILLVTLTTDRQWWPPGEKTWSYYLHWMLVWAFNIAFLTVAITTWNTWMLPRPASLVLGIVVTGLGAGVFIRSVQVMNSDEVAGVTGELYTGGPYAYSRNPQYLGMIIGISGAAMLVNSFWIIVLAVAHIGWVLLLPRTEEPHLREAFGSEYEQYTSAVPRFVGWQSLKRAMA